MMVENVHQLIQGCEDENVNHPHMQMVAFQLHLPFLVDQFELHDFRVHKMAHSSHHSNLSFVMS